MEDLLQYFLSLTAAAVLCGIINGMMPGNGAAQKLIKLLSGLLLTLTALQPVSRLDLPQFLKEWNFELSQGEYAAEDGEIIARDAMAKIIKDNCEAYILDKAAELGLSITVQMSLNRDDIPKPVSVEIIGTVSPYGKLKLQQIIANDLGIPKEAQTWTVQP